MTTTYGTRQRVAAEVLIAVHSRVFAAAIVIAVAFGLAACSTFGAPSQSSVGTVQPTQAPATTPPATPDQTPNQSMTSPPQDTLSPSPIASLEPEVAAILDNPNEQLHLGSISPDHVTTITEDQAEQLAFSLLSVPGPALYVSHGVDLRSSALPTVWLVIVKVPDMQPIPVGPGCPPDAPSDCTQAWAVTDYAVALISDDTGDMDRTFSAMRIVPAPSSSPQ